MVTLSKPVAGDTDWATEINDNWTKLENAVAGLPPVGGRLQRDSATQISFQQYAGNYVDVNGEVVSIASSGPTRAASDNLITSTGADAGAAMAASTLYYVYISNSSASFSASSIRASATAPSLLNGVKYLGASGNAANWRFIGWVRTNGSTQFVDDSTDRLVVNYYNRRTASIELTPGYVDNDSQTTYTLTSTNWTEVNGGTGARGSYISNGEDQVLIIAMADASNVDSGASRIGIGENSTTTAITASVASAVTNRQRLPATYSAILAEGYRTVSLLGCRSSGTTTIYADDARRGGSSDPRVTYLYATVRV